MAKRKRGRDDADASAPEKKQKPTSGQSNGIHNSHLSQSNGNVTKTPSDSFQPQPHIPNTVVPQPPLGVLTPWKLSDLPSGTPDLPKVKDPALLTAAFTHSGLTTTHSDISYERLEWVGDAYIYLYSTILISQTFSTLTPGQSCEIRELLLKNTTLAKYAELYDFESRARLPREFRHDAPGRTKVKKDERIKVMADMFEAYVAAVILADAEYGAERAALWLKKLWGQTIRDRIKALEETNVQQQHQQSITASSDAAPKFNVKVKLAQMLKTKIVELEYKDIESEITKTETGRSIFKVGVFLSGWGYENVKLGEGEAPSKKEAGAKAAEMALANQELLQPFHELKVAFDEKNKRAREEAEAGVSRS